MEQQIGINAGIVWNCLDIEGRQLLKDLKKSSNLADKDLYTALGWLAREGKIALNQEKNDIEVVLL